MIMDPNQPPFQLVHDQLPAQPEEEQPNPLAQWRMAARWAGVAAAVVGTATIVVLLAIFFTALFGTPASTLQYLLRILIFAAALATAGYLVRILALAGWHLWRTRHRHPIGR